MAQGFSVDADQIRAHAQKVDAVRAKFDAVTSASAFIAGDDQAYGLLCSWMPAILQGRHAKQDELFAYVEENLNLCVDGLRRTADGYDAADGDNADALNRIGQPLHPAS